MASGYYAATSAMFYASMAVYANPVWNEAVGRQKANDAWEQMTGQRLASEPRITGPVNHATPFCPDLEL